MCNRSKGILFLIGISIIGCVVFIEIFFEKRERVKDCKAIYSDGYYCVIENKVINTQDHGTLKMYCKDLQKDSCFVFLSETYL
jgi:hypothetical protein